MYKITQHPILEISEQEKVSFLYNDKKIEGEKGFTIAAALHQAGFPIHSHSLRDRERSLECGIGKCGACEMLVDGQIRRICITKVDGIKQVKELPKDYTPGTEGEASIGSKEKGFNVYKTTVAIIGAGPAGLAAREVFNNHKIDNIVIDNNDKIGGQFLMQTHQFFFFENEKKYGGLRGFEIAKKLAGDNNDNIFLNSTVWDILEGRRIAVKNINTNEIYFVESEYIVITTGAVPFMPVFENDDLPGVYTAAVVQKMMNIELTLLGKNFVTVGAGNIGYLTSYQLMQAGAKVKAIVEAQSFEGGFPVQANRVRRIGVPILLSHTILKAIPNKNHDGITGIVVAECKDFKAIPGTEKLIDGIDAVNICTGLEPDNQLLIKGKEIFGLKCKGGGDAIRIGEGTSAVLRGKQLAYEIIENIGIAYNYDSYLQLSKEYIDSQQHPLKVLEVPAMPTEKRMNEKTFVKIDCLYGFACNPCVFACPSNAISKSSTSSVPIIDYEKCTGCLDCVWQCPGLAIFGYNVKKDWIFLPIEFSVKENSEVFLTDNMGKKVGEGVIEKVFKKTNKTDLVRIKAKNISGEELLKANGFIVKEQFPEEVVLKDTKEERHDLDNFICHCDDVKFDEILNVIGNRKFISIDEIKHTTRLGMGACRGKRCFKRLKQKLRAERYGITVVGEITPRGPMSNQVLMGDMFPHKSKEVIIPNINNGNIRKVKVKSLIAGGGIAGSSLFRYMSEAGLEPVMINYDRGASWRNIGGGRPAFTVPELSDIANNNHEIFKELQKIKNIDYRTTKYVNFAHDEDTYKSLEKSLSWSDAYLVEPKDFVKEISPFLNSKLNKYKAAFITNNCWQATPGKVVDLIRTIGIEKGGTVLEDCRLIDLTKENTTFKALVLDHNKEYVEYSTEIFINALGAEAGTFTDKIGIHTGVYPVKHQAFITRRLPMLGNNGAPLPMLIDRRNYKGFTAVYGQQFVETGQIIGCASPAIEALETKSDLKVNSKDFMEIVSEIFVDWLPNLSSVGFQAVWAGYYTEPRIYIDTDAGLFIGLRGQGYMLGQYLAKLYVDKLSGKAVPEYFERLGLKGDGLPEKAFK